MSRVLTQEFWAVLVARAFMGLLAAWAMGAVGFFVAFYLIFPGTTTSLMVLTPTAVSLTALGTGLGGTAAWLRPDRRRWVAGLTAAVLIAAMVGGWAGFLTGVPETTGEVIDIQSGKPVEPGNPVTRLVTNRELGATVLGGTVAANLIGAAGYLFRVTRARTVPPN